MFKWLYNEYGAPQTRLTHLLATNSEGFGRGQSVNLASGRFTIANGVEVPAAVSNQVLAAGTDKFLEVIQIREGDVFEAPYTGTPAAGFVAGANAVAIATDGFNVDAATVTGGSIAIIEVNTTKQTCRLKFKSRQLS